MFLLKFVWHIDLWLLVIRVILGVVTLVSEMNSIVKWWKDTNKPPNSPCKANCFRDRKYWFQPCPTCTTSIICNQTIDLHIILDIIWLHHSFISLWLLTYRNRRIVYHKRNTTTKCIIISIKHTFSIIMNEPAETVRATQPDMVTSSCDHVKLQLMQLDRSASSFMYYPRSKNNVVKRVGV